MLPTSIYIIMLPISEYLTLPTSECHTLLTSKYTFLPSVEYFTQPTSEYLAFLAQYVVTQYIQRQALRYLSFDSVISKFLTHNAGVASEQLPCPERLAGSSGRAQSMECGKLVTQFSLLFV